MTKNTTSPIKVSTGIESSLSFIIYTTYTDLTYVEVDYGDETLENLNISGNFAELFGFNSINCFYLFFS